MHQYEDLIAQATRDQKKLQQEIAVYQGRVALSPAIEEEYKELARDYDNAQKNYQDLLADQSKSDLALKMDQQQQGEQMASAQSRELAGSPELPEPAAVCRRRVGRRAGAGDWPGLVAGIA